MTNQADDVNSIIATKAGLKYTGIEVDAMKLVADAYSKRSLKVLLHSALNLEILRLIFYFLPLVLSRNFNEL